MFRRSIATLLSAALVATSVSTAPARADEDVIKVLGGLVALGIIAKAIDDRNDRKKRQRAATGKIQPYKVTRPHVGTIGPKLRPRRLVKIAPEQCLQNTWTHQGPRPVYAARCMKHYSRAQLPHSCLRENQTLSGPRYYYTPRCLHEHGWRT
jgi:hypothetical protein